MNVNGFPFSFPHSGLSGPRCKQLLILLAQGHFSSHLWSEFLDEVSQLQPVRDARDHQLHGHDPRDTHCHKKQEVDPIEQVQQHGKSFLRAIPQAKLCSRCYHICTYLSSPTASPIFSYPSFRSNSTKPWLIWLMSCGPSKIMPVMSWMSDAPALILV